MKIKETTDQISKTQIKKRYLAVIKKVKNLSSYSKKEIEMLSYPREIKDELLKLNNIKSQIAKNRQIKYIASLINNLNDA